MTTLKCTALTLACALCLGRGAGPAQAATDASAPRDLAPELAAWLATQPKWSWSAAVESAFGYKDNLVLSPAGEEGSTFARGGLELLLLRVPGGRFEYSLFARADGTYYFSGDAVDHDAKGWVQTELGYQAGKRLRLSVPVTGYYYDQVFDVSDSESERVIAKMKMGGVMAAPAVRWTFHPAWWFEAQAAAERKTYDDHANDGRVREGALRLAWRPSARIEARLTAAERRREFKQRTQYTAAGRPLPGTELDIVEREGEGRLEINWDSAGRWRSIVRAVAIDYRDNGSGYFNYREKKIAHEVEWRGDPWRVRVGATAKRIDFAIQTVGFGVDPPGRLKDEYTGEVWVERKVSTRWSVFGAYTWERSRSNDVVASFVVNEGLLGARWSWDK